MPEVYWVYYQFQLFLLLQTLAHRHRPIKKSLQAPSSSPYK